MKVMEEQWINNLRVRFADWEQPAPNGLWEDIEATMSELGAESGSGTKSERRVRALPMRWRKAVAAAACLVIIAGVTGWLMTRTDSDETAIIGLTDEKTAISVVSDIKTGRQEQPAQSEEPQSLAAQAVNRLAAFVGKRIDKTMKTTAAVAQEERLFATNNTETAAVTVTNGTEERVKESSESKTQSHEAAAIEGAGKKPYTSQRPVKLPNTSHNNRQRGVSFGLYGMGLTAMNGSDASGSVIDYYSGVQSDVSFNNGFDFPTNIVESERIPVLAAEEVSVKHRQPIKAGVSARFQLTDRLGIESGLYYSRLLSDFVSSARIGGYKTEQRLHYIGVPLKMTCSIWKNGSFDVYAGAGGAVEIGISGSSHTDYLENGETQRSEDNDVKDTRPQFSVNASAGVQYNFNGTVGAFLEPGVSYYINNGSRIQNFYKDKPWSLNLSLGLRFTVK